MDTTLDLSIVSTIFSTQSLRFNTEEAQDLKSLLLQKIDDDEFALNIELIKTVVMFNKMHCFHAITEQKYHELIVKNSSYKRMKTLSANIQSLTKIEEVRNTVFKWLFKYGFNKALYRFMDIHNLPFNSQYPALSKYCVSNILMDLLFEHLNIEKKELTIKKIKEFEKRILANKEIAQKKIKKTIRFAQHLGNFDVNLIDTDSAFYKYIYKIFSILKLHFLIFELFTEESSPSDKYAQPVNIFKLGECYFKLNEKFFRTAKNKDILKAREKYSQIYSLLDYMPRIIRIFLLSYHYINNKEKISDNDRYFVGYYSDLDSQWNIKKAAKFLEQNTDDVNSYKRLCTFVCKLITNYIEVNNFKYRVGSITLKDEVEN